MDVESFTANRADVAGHYATQGARKPKHPPRRMLVDLPRHTDGERFIQGPIPMVWMRLASRCGGRGEAVGLLLWYAAGWQRSNPVKLSRSILAELGVHPKTAKRVLTRMADLGLVDAEFHRGRSPVVTIRDPSGRMEN